MMQVPTKAIEIDGAVDITEVCFPNPSIQSRSTDPALAQAALPGLNISLRRASASLHHRPSPLPITSFPTHSQAFPNAYPQGQNSLLSKPNPNPFARPPRSPSRVSPGVGDEGNKLQARSPATLGYLTPMSAEVAQLQNEKHTLDRAMGRVGDEEGEMMDSSAEEEIKPFDDVDLGGVNGWRAERRRE